MHSVKLEGKVCFSNVESLIKQLTYDKSLKEIWLDLHGVTFIEPAGMSLLTAYINHMAYTTAQAGGRIQFKTVPPKNEDVERYLRRMDFYNNIGIEIQNGFARHDGTGSFKEVLILHSEHDSNQVSEDLVKILKAQTQIDDAFLHIMRYSVTEIAENIFHHAESPVGGVVCAQAYANKIQISVIDSGKGIPGNIRLIQGSEKLDDKSALEKAVQLRVTSTPKRNSGQGLFFSSQITALNGGTFTIWSLNGSIHMSLKGLVKKESPFWQGTAVVFELPRQIKTSIKDLMDKYAPPKGDFELIKEI